jgi:hypothetical protein
VFGKVGEGLEAAGTRSVIFEVVGVDVEVLLEGQFELRKMRGRWMCTWKSFFAMLSYAPSEK